MLKFRLSWFFCTRVTIEDSCFVLDGDSDLLTEKETSPIEFGLEKWI